MRMFVELQKVSAADLRKEVSRFCYPSSRVTFACWSFALQLRITFAGEDAIDEGGVKKEVMIDRSIDLFVDLV